MASLDYIFRGDELLAEANRFVFTRPEVPFTEAETLDDAPTSWAGQQAQPPPSQGKLIILVTLAESRERPTSSSWIMN